MTAEGSTSMDLQDINQEGTLYMWMYCGINAELNSITKVIFLATKKKVITVNFKYVSIILYIITKSIVLTVSLYQFLYWAFQNGNSVKTQLSCVYRLLKDNLYYINILRFSGQIQMNKSSDLSDYSLSTLFY